jgi:hypothetical protein
MKRILLVCCVGATLTACDGDPRRGSVLPRPSHPVAPAPAEYRTIAIGEGFTDEILDEVRYIVRAPAAGVVTVKLDWVERYLSDGGDQFLALVIDDNWVSPQGCGISPPAGSSIRVVADQTVRIVVSRTHCWDLIHVRGLLAPFTMSTSFEAEQ